MRMLLFQFACLYPFGNFAEKSGYRRIDQKEQTDQRRDNAEDPASRQPQPAHEKKHPAESAGKQLLAARIKALHDLQAELELLRIQKADRVHRRQHQQNHQQQ